MERTSLGLLFILTITGTALATLSNLRRCGDPACKEPVAEGITLLGFPSNDKDILSFPNKAKVIIYSKDAGNRTDLWGVEIKGKRGYVPKKYIRESKILKSKLEFEVSTELFDKKHEDIISKQNLSDEEFHNDQDEADQETRNIENPVHEKVAITAEDSEYILNVPDIKEEYHPEEAENKPADVDPESIEDVREESQVEINENTTEDDEAGKKEENDDEKEKEEEKIDNDIFIEQEQLIEVEEKEYSSNIVDNLLPIDSKAQDDILQSQISASSIVSEIIEETATIDEPHYLSSLQLEASSVNIEVIEGTTIYYNDDLATPTPTLPDVQATTVPQVSPVVEENYATVEPRAVFPQSSIEALLTQDADSDAKLMKEFDDKASKTLDPLNSTPVLENLVKPSVVEPASELPKGEVPTKEGQLETESPTTTNLRNLVLPPTIMFEEQEMGVSEEDNGKQENQDESIKDAIDIPPFSTETTSDSQPTTDNTSDSQTETTTDNINDSQLETITKTMSETSTELSTSASITQSTSEGAEQAEGEVRLSKPDAVLDKTRDKVEELKESAGFFASWFGSTEEEATEEVEDDEIEEFDRAHGEVHDIESANVSEGNRAVDDHESIVDVNTNVSHDSAPIIHVDESKSSLDNAQVPYPAENVDSLPLTPPSLVISTDSTASDSTEQLTQPPSPLDALTPALSDLGDGSDDVNINGEGETGPGPSTARPLYAEPEPTTSSYSPHTSVHSDEMNRLADRGDESISKDDSEINSAEGSLTEKFLKTSHNLLPEGLAFGVEAELANPVMSSGVIVFLGLVMATIISIYIIHLVMMKLSRESPMLQALNNVDRENRLVTAENTTLHEQLCQARAELTAVSTHVTESSEDITKLDSQLDLIKGEHASEKALLEEKIIQLEHELEEATTNGMEMHKMLSEMLSSQKDTSSFQASVDHLQDMLDGQREKVETLNSDLALKTRLNEELHSELSTGRERITNLDSQVQQLTKSLKELSSAKEDLSNKFECECSLVKDLQEVNESLSRQTLDSDTSITAMTLELRALQDTISQLREIVDTKDSELQVAKECLKQLRLMSDDDQATPDDEKLSSLFDVIQVKAELQRVRSERSEIKKQLQDAEIAQRNLEDGMSSIRLEVTHLKKTHDEAVQAKQEALSRLEVLTKYFEEKEAQLTKELESQEGLRVGAEGAAATGASKLHNYGLELSTYRAQVESLRKELEDQETSYKAQIASYEQKVHNNWLQARSAERRQEEQRQENSQLRTRLTLLQKEREETHHPQISKLRPKCVDANGSVSSPGLEGEVEGNHRDVDSPPVVPHPQHAPLPMLPPMMFPPGAPLPPGVPPHHGLPPGVRPPPGLPHGVPPPHGLPPPPFLPGDASFMRHPLHPLPGDRRLPPAGGMSSPPFRRSGSPSYDHRNDRYSPASEHSHFSDRHYSPPPLCHRPVSPDMHRRNHSPDRRSDRIRSPDRRSDRMRSPDRRSNRHTSDRRSDRRSPERHFNTRSPEGYSRHRSSPHHYFDHSDLNSNESRIHPSYMKGHVTGKKTSTPLSSTDRWKNDS